MNTLNSVAPSQPPTLIASLSSTPACESNRVNPPPQRNSTSHGHSAVAGPNAAALSRAALEPAIHVDEPSPPSCSTRGGGDGCASGEPSSPALAPSSLASFLTFEYSGNPYTSPRRYIVLAVFCIYSFSNAMQWLAYSPIPTAVRHYYGISAAQLNLLSNIYMIIYSCLPVMSCIGMEKLGLRWFLIVGTALNAMGALMKVVVGFPADTFLVIFVAQLLNSFSQIFVLSVPPMLALVWFRESERATATAIGSVAFPLGCAFGQLIPPTLVRMDGGGGAASDEGAGAALGEGLLQEFGIQFLFAAIAFVGAVQAVPSVLAPAAAQAKGQVRATSTSASEMVPIDEGGTMGSAGPQPSEGALNPVTSDSNSLCVIVATTSSSHLTMESDNVAHADGDDGHDPTSLGAIFHAMYLLLQDMDSVACAMGAAICVGAVWTVNTLLAQVLAPINISEQDAGMMGFWNIILGTVVAVGAGVVVDRVRVYKLPLVAFSVMNLALHTLIIWFMYADTTSIGDAPLPQTRIGIYAVNVLSGIPQNTITPIGFEFLMELSYGHPGSISGGLLMLGANAFSVIFIIIGGALMGDAPIATKESAIDTMWLLWVVLAISIALLVLPKNNLKRLRAQQERQQEQDVAITAAQ